MDWEDYESRIVPQNRIRRPLLRCRDQGYGISQVQGPILVASPCLEEVKENGAWPCEEYLSTKAWEGKDPM